MSEDQAEVAESAILRELMLLAARGATAESLRKCPGIYGFVLGELLPRREILSVVQGSLVRKALEVAIAEQREIAISTIGDRLRGDEKNSDEFRISAAGELVGLVDESAFRKVKEVREFQLGESWEEIAAKRDNRKSAPARRRTRAAYWLGDTSARGVESKEGPLLEALRAAVVVYFADNRKAEQFRAEFSELVEAMPPEVAAQSVMQESRSEERVPSSNRPGVTPALTRADPYVEEDLRDLIGAFAKRVLDKLEAEHRDREVSSPIPIRVRWEMADSHLSDRVENILQARRQTSELVLKGDIDEVAERFRQLPLRRLVVLGGGGSGKTVLATELAIAMLQPPLRAKADSPVPFLFSLTSWSPSDETLQQWMISQLEMLHPELKKKLGSKKETIAGRLVHGHHIVPILDGFDEIDPSLREIAVRELNLALSRGRAFVMTSRREEYELAIAGHGEVLHFAAAVEMQPISFDDLSEYLPRTSRNEGANAENLWDGLLESLRDGSEQSFRILNVLSTPLMVWLARSLYSRGGRKPDELLDRERFPDKISIEDHLISRFVDVKYESDSLGRKSSRFAKESSARWLGHASAYLAAHGEGYFSWWLTRSPFSRFFLLLLLSLGMISGYFLGDFSADYPVVVLALAVGWIVVFAGAVIGVDTPPVRLVFPRAKPILQELQSSAGASRLIRLLALIIMSATAVGAVAIYLVTPPVNRQYTLLLYAIGFFAVVFIWTSRAPDLRLGSSPGSLLRSDLGGAVARGCITGAGYSVICVVFFASTEDWQWLIALPILFSAAVCAALMASAAGWWLITSSLSALLGTGPAPWRFSSFFEDAYRKGFLRQVGGAYQFRHASLQSYFLQSLDSLSSVRGGRDFRAAMVANYARAELAAGDLGRLATAEGFLREYIRDEIERKGFLKQDVFLLWMMLVRVAYERGGKKGATDVIAVFEQVYSAWISDLRSSGTFMRFARSRRIVESHDRNMAWWVEFFVERVEEQEAVGRRAEVEETGSGDEGASVS